MKHVTDEELILLYYGESDDPDLAARVAGSSELSARYDALTAELGKMDEWLPPARDETFGAKMWQRISPQLEETPEPRMGPWQRWFAAAARPRFSLAGAFALALVAGLAFMLGRQGAQTAPVGPIEIPTATVTAAAGDTNGDRLLTSSLSGHLGQINLLFTEFANQTDAGAVKAEQAMDMLVANRLYRQVLTSRGEGQLAAFLAELEPLLIELAHEAQAGTPATRARMQQEVRDGLLFRVRIMNRQLEQSNIRT